MNDCGCDSAELFSWSTFQNELKMAAHYGIGMATESIPFSLVEESEAADLNSIEGTEAVSLTNIIKLPLISSKEGRLCLANMYKHGIDQGYF